MSTRSPSSPEPAGSSPRLAGAGPRVRRSARFGWIALVVFAIVVALMALTPVSQPVSTINNLTQLLILVVIGIMWNLLAGYAGLVSIGLQAFVGL
ncbi:MAG: hypothetical protein ABR946_02560, partial [Solirubrobacteraceae bacterium]